MSNGLTKETPSTDFSILDFAKAWYGTKPFERGGRIAVQVNGFRNVSYAESAEQYAELVDSLPDKSNIFHTVGLTTSTDPHSRGRKADIVAIPGFYIDADCYGRKGPEQKAKAIELLDQLPLTPTILIDSGYGLHAYFAFDQPWYFETAQDADRIVYGWWAHVDQHFRAHDFEIDKANDIARVLRAPETINVKKDRPPAEVSIIRIANARYSVDEFLPYAKDRPSDDITGKVGERAEKLTEIDSLPEEITALIETDPSISRLMGLYENGTPEIDYDSASELDAELVENLIGHHVYDDDIAWAVIRRARALLSDEDKVNKAYRRSYIARTLCYVDSKKPRAIDDFGIVPTPESICLSHRVDSFVTRVCYGLGRLGREIFVLPIDRDRLTVYQRSGRLVRVMKSNEAGKEVYSIAEVPRDQLPSLASEACYLWKLVGRKEPQPQAISLPAEIGKAIDTRGTYPDNIPELHGIATSPIVRPDGTVWQDHGYDAATRMEYRPDADYPAIEVHPPGVVRTLLDRYFFDLLVDYPFATDADRSAALALPMTVLCRSAIDGCTPMLTVSANTSGAGKGLLFQVLIQIALGHEPTILSYTHNDAEMRKEILAILAAAPRVCLLDNLATVLGVPSLDAAITARYYSGRVLGKTQLAGRLINNTVFLATGNNIRFGADMSRRVMPIRLSSPLARPEDRTDFKHPNIVDHVKETRHKAVAAILTAVRSYMAAGCPAIDQKTWGSFEAWTKIIRGTITWLGYADPLDAREIVRANDQTADHFGILVGVIEECMASMGGEITVADIARHISDASFDETKPMGRIANAEIFNGEIRAGFSGASRLGYKLRDIESKIYEERDANGVVIARKKVVKESKGQRVMKWRVEPLTIQDGPVA